ncbi:glycosyltransferase family 2 protein [Streptococcus orisratti]
MSELISVVVTCYNHEKYITQCLESIFNQTYKNIELFVINDGSTDSSLDIIEKTIMESPYKNSRLINQSNIGLVASRNKALDYIKGSFVLFVDSDNYLTNSYISDLLKVATDESADIVYGNLINPSTGLFHLCARNFDLSDLFIGNYIDSCSLIRVSIIGEVRYDTFLNYKKLEDYDFFLNLILNQHAKARPAYNASFYYRVIEDSMSQRGDLLRHYLAYLHILNKYRVGNEKLVDNAIQIQFPHNNKLSIYNQKVTIYFSKRGEEFNEKRTLKYTFKEKDSILFSIDSKYDQIRIDLSEIPSFYQKVSLITNEFRTEILPSFTNGTLIGNYVMFTESDPQLIYDISKIEKKNFTLSYSMFNVDNINSADFVAKILTQNLLEASQEINNLNSYKVQFEIADQERLYYKTALEEMVVRYNSVTHSRRWTIPTKIINFFRRKK